MTKKEIEEIQNTFNDDPIEILNEDEVNENEDTDK